MTFRRELALQAIGFFFHCQLSSNRSSQGMDLVVDMLYMSYSSHLMYRVACSYMIEVLN